MLDGLVPDFSGELFYNETVPHKAMIMSYASDAAGPFGKSSFVNNKPMFLCMAIAIKKSLSLTTFILQSLSVVPGLRVQEIQSGC